VDHRELHPARERQVDIDYGYGDISLDELVGRRAAWKKQYLPQ
jgi:hypothetical protein